MRSVYTYGALHEYMHCVLTEDEGTLKWTNQWIPFLTSLVQLGFIGESNVKVTTRVQSVQIHPQQHLQSVQASSSGRRANLKQRKMVIWKRYEPMQ